MAWEKINITADGVEIEGVKNGNQIEMPYAEGISTESTISVDGKAIEVTMITNVAERNETLLLEVKIDGKQVKRGTRNKSKSEEVQDKT